MKNFFSIVSTLLLAVLIGACSADNKKAAPETAKSMAAYKLFITTQQKGSTGKPITVTDAAVFNAINDSAAWIEARIRYDSAVTIWQLVKDGPEPIAFKVVNEKNENITTALIPQKNNAAADTAHYAQSADSIKPEPKNTFDSIIKVKPAADSQKSYRRRRPSTTYVPI